MINKKILADEITTDYSVIPSTNIIEAMESTIKPLLSQNGEPFSINSATGHHLEGMVYKVSNPKGTIMISHGFTESWMKFREMIYYYMNEGYNVCIHSHWNHGDSRDVAPMGQPTHIDSFQSYVDDFAAVYDAITAKLEAPRFLYAHSMGGLIGALFVEQHPHAFDKAIFSAPMFEINRGPLPYFVAKKIASFLCLIGKGNSFLPGQGMYSDKEDFENSASDCKNRYLVYYREQVKNPNLQNSGCSCKWALESFLAAERMLQKKNCSRINIPVLLFQAENDTFVLPGGQDKFIENVPGSKLIFVPNTKHEIYLSDDAVLKRYVAAIMGFLNN